MLPQQTTIAPKVDRASAALFWAALILVVIAIIFPRSAAAVFVLATLAAFSLLAADKGRTELRLPVSGLLVWMLGFCGWGMATAFWSPAVAATLSKPLFLIGAVLGVALLPVITAKSDPALRRSVTTGIVIAVLICGTLIAIESLTHQALSRFFMNLFPFLRRGLDKHLALADDVVLAISDANLKRRATVLTLLMVPVGHLLWTLDDRKLRAAGLTALALIALIVLFFTGHQSSQVAIVAASGCFALALVSRRWALRAVAACWIAAVLLAVPLVVAAHMANLQSAAWLPASAQHRVVIWNTTAREVLKAPLFGIGADATATLTFQKEAKAEPRAKDGAYEETTARHAHNAYLQVWYELGLVGVLLFLGAGLAALRQIGAMPEKIQPVLLAEFVVFAALIAFSFSIWQVWFEAAIALGTATLLASTAMVRAGRNPQQSTVVH